MRRRARGQGPHPILLICPSVQYGGMEIHVELLLEYLDRSRYAPSFFVPRNPHTPVLEKLVEHVRALDVPIVRDLPMAMTRVGSIVDNVLGLAALLRREKIRLVHIHDWRPGGDLFPLLAARMTGTRVIRTEHLPPGPDDATGELRATCRRHDRLTDVVLTVSHDNRDRHLEVLGRDPDKVQVLHNGVEMPPQLDDELATSAKIEFGLNPEIPLIGSIGRLHPQKGYRHLLDAAVRIRDQFGPVNVIIAGEGELRPELEQQARDLGIDDFVRFPGFIVDPSHLLAAFDVAVMPSLFEGLSLSMLEMMAAGKPCVFSDHPSFVEATDGGACARLVPIGDVDALATTIVELLRDPAGAAELGRSARQHVWDYFSIGRHIERVMALYDDTIGAHT